METRKIGSLDVSVVGLGCNNFGRSVDEAGTRLAIDSCERFGVTLLDTADIYGGTLSETYLGSALQGRREKFIIATKFGFEVAPDKKGARPEYVLQACEDSLRRLRVDYIDLYQLHTPDPDVPISETLGALNALVEAGKVREIGCSNFGADRLREAEIAATGAKFVCVQNELSLLRQGDQKAVLEECRRQGISFLPFFPLASGLLTGKYRKGRPLPEGTRIGADSPWLGEENLDTVEHLAAFAAQHGRSLLELAFAWLLAHEPVASVIAGATKPEQIEANAKAASWKLTAVERHEAADLAEQ